MIIKTFRLNKKLCGAVLIFCVLACTFFVFFTGGDETVFAQKDGVNYNKAGTNEQRLAILSQLGWQVGEEAVRIQEITIPETFDDVYLEYNELQKKAGFDLEKYKGKRAKLYSYEILNGANAPDDPVYITLLIYKDKVIGGDIASARLDGFMREIYKKEENHTNS